MGGGLGFLSWVMIGGLAGWLLARLAGSGHDDWPDDALAGACAASLGGLLFALATDHRDPFVWDNGAFLAALGGAAAMVAILGVLRRV